VSSHTREAIPALLTGRYPDVAVGSGFSLTADTIASHLDSTPYATGAFHSNPFVSRAYGFDRDFDRFDDDLHLGQHKLLALGQRFLDKLRNRHYAPAEEINERSLQWIDTLEEPFFAWNHYMDPHGPYDPPAEQQTRFYDETVRTRRSQKLYKRAAVTDPESITEQERREMVNLYDGEVRHVDEQIAAFTNALDERGLLDQSLVIITADHGDAFGEHGYYGHPRQLHDELIHVPLILAGADVPDVEIKAPVTLLDLVPTMLEVVGVDVPKLPGRSLPEAITNPEQSIGRRVYSQVRGMDDETHLRRYSLRTKGELCTIERVIESGEMLAEKRSEGADEGLQAELREHSDERLSAGGGPMSEPADEPSDEIERRLAALGYKK
jgi:arylsulfatase